MNNKIAIIGFGKLGQTLAKAFKNTTWNVVGIFDKESGKGANLVQALQLKYHASLETILFEADIIFLTVPDQLIQPIAKEIATLNSNKEYQYFFHCSGSHTLDALQPLHTSNIGCFHPLQAFTENTTSLENTYIAIDGEQSSLSIATKLAHTLNAIPIHVPANEKPLYHAAACILSNYLISLTCIAEDIFMKWSIPREALLGLLQSTVSNIESATNTASALTGPLSRGDSNTISQHLEVLPNKYLQLYCQLGLQTLDIAKTNGTITENSYLELRRLLNNKI